MSELTKEELTRLLQEAEAAHRRLSSPRSSEASATSDAVPAWDAEFIVDELKENSAG